MNQYKKFWDVITVNFVTQEVLAPDGEWYKYDSLVEFTGLLDKNSKEIYEGDVVKHRRLDGSTDSIKYGLTGVWRGNKPIEVKYENCGFSPFSVYISDAISDLEFEIIGNIYENKDLLT